MRRLHRTNAARDLPAWLRVVAATAGAVALPAACLYPDYSFDEKSGASTSTGAAGGADPGPASSSSGSSTAASGGEGGGASSSSTGVGGALGEDCTNGVDDDGDGMIDCDDGECAAYACVAVVPQGWTGYYALYEGAPASDPGCVPDFPGGASETEYTGNNSLINAQPAQCSPCTCATPAGQSCVGPATLDVDDGTCAQSPKCGASLPLGTANGTCTAGSFLAGGDTFCGSAGDCTSEGGGTAPCNVGASAAAPTVTGGSCSPSGGAVTKPTPGWMNVGHACGGVTGSSGGCNLNQVCLPRPPAPFENGVCIRADGALPCPGGVFSEQHVFYGGFNDTRGCSSCSCGAPSGSSCQVSISMFDNASCTGTPVGSVIAGSCSNLTGNPTVYGRRATVTQPPSGGSCSPSGGQPTGSVTAQNATTFCCIP